MVCHKDASVVLTKTRLWCSPASRLCWQGEYVLDEGPWDANKFPARQPKDGDAPGVLRDGKGDKYRIWRMHVKATASGELTGLCLPGERPDPANPKTTKPGFQVESFQELCEIDVGEVGWKACVLPLSEWPAA